MPDQTAFADQEFLNDPAAGTVGDCWRACIASMLGRPRADVPHFVARPETEFDWLEQTQHWLRAEYGQELHYVMAKFPVEKSCSQYVIIVGRSPRGLGHAVLASAATGELVHDPHPSRDGLESITGVFVLSEPWETADVLLEIANQEAVQEFGGLVVDG